MGERSCLISNRTITLGHLQTLDIPGPHCPAVSSWDPGPTIYRQHLPTLPMVGMEERSQKRPLPPPLRHTHTLPRVWAPGAGL